MDSSLENVENTGQNRWSNQAIPEV
jgi:hypothetical protein